MLPIICFTVPGGFWPSFLAAVAFSVVATQILRFWKPLRRFPFLNDNTRFNLLLTSSEMRLWHEQHSQVPGDSLGLGLVFTQGNRI